MKDTTLRAGNYISATARKVDLDLPGSSCAVSIEVFADQPVSLYGVNEKQVIPVGTGTHILFERRCEGLTSFRIATFGRRVTTLAYRCEASLWRSHDRSDPIPVEGHVDFAELPQDTFSQAVTAMVRQQLRAAGLDPDGDIREFADGDMSFIDDDDLDFRSAYEEAEEEFLAERPPHPEKDADGTPEADEEKEAEPEEKPTKTKKSEPPPKKDEE